MGGDTGHEAGQALDGTGKLLGHTLEQGAHQARYHLKQIAGQLPDASAPISGIVNGTASAIHSGTGSQALPATPGVTISTGGSTGGTHSPAQVQVNLPQTGQAAILGAGALMGTTEATAGKVLSGAAHSTPSGLQLQPEASLALSLGKDAQH